MVIIVCIVISLFLVSCVNMRIVTHSRYKQRSATIGRLAMWDTQFQRESDEIQREKHRQQLQQQQQLQHQQSLITAPPSHISCMLLDNSNRSC